jgi:hypothetical protein
MKFLCSRFSGHIFCKLVIPATFTFLKQLSKTHLYKHFTFECMYVCIGSVQKLYMYVIKAGRNRRLFDIFDNELIDLHCRSSVDAG